MNFVASTLVSRIAVLTALMIGLGGGAAAVCGLLSGWPGVEGALFAIALCWLPGMAVFCIEPQFRTPMGQVGVALIGTFLRIVVAAGGALLLMQVRTELPRGPFLGSVLVLYLASLAWETMVLAKPAAAQSPRQPAA